MAYRLQIVNMSLFNFFDEKRKKDDLIKAILEN